MRKTLVNQQCLTQKLLQLSLLCAMMLMPKHAWAQINIEYYGITVGGVEVTSQNAMSVTGDNISNGMVSYSAQDNTLTLNGATISSGGITCQDNLRLSIIGSVTVNGNITSSKQNGATLTLQHGDDTAADLTYNPTSGGAASGFTSVVYDGMYLTPAVYDASYQLTEGNRRDVKYSPSRQRFEESEWSSLSTVKFTSAKNYELWLGGTKVTDANKNDILEDDVPKASFNPSNNTLTLNGITLTSTWIYDSGIISRLPNLKIVVNGENKITCNDSCTAIRADMEGAQTLTIENGDNDGSLTFTASHAIRDFNSLTLTGLHWVDGNNYAFENATTSSNYGSHTGTQVVDKSGDSPVEVGNATLSSKYSLKVGGVDVTDANASNITGNNITTGTVSFNASTNTLTLNGATLTEPIIVGMPNLTIDIQGNNTITTNTTCIQKLNENTNPSLTFKSTSNAVGSLILKNTDEDNYGGVNKINNVSFSKELALIMYRYGSYTSNTYYFTAGEVYNAQIVPSYGVKVGDLFVYEGNFNDVLGDGKVSFNQATHTLTLNNASISSDGEAISTSLPELIIELIGNNTLKSGSYSTLQSLYGDDVTMTVQSSGATKGCLVLKMDYSSNNVFAGDHVTLNITSTLEVVSGNLNVNDGNLNVVTIGEPVGYELLVEDVRVVAANASNITNATNWSGRPYASFDAATNTLTLDNSDFYYYIYGSKVPVQSDIQDLKVKLVGDNEVTLGSKVFKYTGTVSGSAPKLTFVTEMVDDAYGSLEINGTTSTEDIADGYQITNTLLPADANQGTTGWLYSVGNNFSLWYQEAYGITVKKDDRTVSVTNANRIDVLGDADPYNNKPATVQFDGRSRLVLNGADLTSIVVSGTNNLPESGLDVYLEGDNKITNTLGYAIASEGVAAMEKLAFYTGGDAPGTLTYTNSGAASENVFSGFNVTYNNNLAKFVDGNVTLVRMPLGLFVNEVGTPAVVTYTSSPAGGDNIPLDNDIFNKMLYTLDDDGTKDSPDGYDQDKQAIVINTVMTDAAVKAIDTNVTIPGTPAYAKVFKGLTFIVPAGTGEITLNGLNTADHYAFHIMIGSQDPVEVIHNNGNGDVTVPYASSEASYVKIYLVELPIIAPIDAPAMKVDHRIGPKSSVGGALGGVKVSNSSVQSTADPAATYKAMEVATMAADIANLGDAYNGYSCNDPDITDLPDNLFVDNGGSSAPRKAGGKISGTILPEGLTFIDFSETKIMCMEVDREKGAFKGVPENVFIYMPAGNSFAAGTKNVVIGGICDVAELDGSSYAQPFKAKKDFKAGQATLKRTFEAGSTDSKATIYLPYNIAQEDANKLGTFYAYTGNDGTTVTMNKVTTGGLKANKPYIFEAKEGGVQNPMVHGVDIVANPAETEGFKGVYKRKNYESGMYCYVGEDKSGKYTIGQFVEMGPGSYVPPFRAYMIGNGAPSYAIAWDGEVDIVQNEENTTAVETVKTDNNVKTQDGWWTINGMRLKAQPKKAGLYILNGRMVAVK